MSTPSRKVSTSSIVNSLAKRFDPHALQHQGPTTTTEEPAYSLAAHRGDSPSESPSNMHRKFDFLSQKIDQLLLVQDNVLHKLDCVSQDVDGIAKHMVTSRTEKEDLGPDCKVAGREDILETKELCLEMNRTLSHMNTCTEQHIKRMETVEHIVLGIQQFISFLAEKLKTSKLVELLLHGPVAHKTRRSVEARVSKKDKAKGSCKRALPGKKDTPPCKRKIKVTRDQTAKEKKVKSYLGLRGTQSLKKKKTPDSTDVSDEHALHEEEEPGGENGNTVIQEDQRELEHSVDEESNEDQGDGHEEGEEPETKEEGGGEKTSLNNKKFCKFQDQETESESTLESEEKEHHEACSAEGQDHTTDSNNTSTAETLSYSEANDGDQELKLPAAIVEERNPNCTVLLERYEDSDQDPSLLRTPEKEIDRELPETPEQSCLLDSTGSSKRRVTEEDPIKDDNKKSRVDTEPSAPTSTTEEPLEPTQTLSIPTEESLETDSTEDHREDLATEDNGEELVIVECPAPAAPFDHRIVSARHAQINNYYTVNRAEIIGGGRFGQVHICTEKLSGLTLAAKIIKAKFLKQKEEVKNEIFVMNQLNHSNLIQLYDAFESKHDIVLVMEYVAGGELFDRIIDESYSLTEMDTILFIKQICEGIQYMHQMYIIHLDLKPENILCVNRATNQIKIIDFGLARRYKPREKLKVHFGTPEFLAPEVVNYEFVSFPTDMWSIGVIAYMLLSGLSPFMGEDDNETLNNIICCRWGFENEEFQDVSEEAKDFITKLLIKDKSWRISAKESLKHSWLTDPELHCGLNLKRKMKCVTDSQATMAQ
ncbi:myosin light chain kinase family member 4 isoform X2 [Ambystoma mexicanum]|uniref:myosin light chain kinase family member 4 isoform X2 n=1 Tax=Ambystoma mexicanum TaxID=8296 RepID=UPI0037E808B9